ncbi:MAG: CoA transferase [Chloroflexota bacterium]
MEQTKGPLEGVRVLAVEQATGGPFGTTMLADLGAEVIMVELPGEARPRQYPWGHKGEDAHFLALGRNKKSITIDLTKETGREVFHELVKHADVVFDNLRPSVPKRLGIDYETLKVINPRIVSCSLSGYGSTGPYRDRPAFERIVQSLSGMMSIIGEEGRSPPIAGWAVVDTSGGMASAFGITAALYSREKTGVGQKIDVAMLDVQIAMLCSAAANYLIAGAAPEKMGSRWPSNPLHGVFQAKDGYMTLAAHRQGFWVKLCQALGREELAGDPRFDVPAKRSKNGVELWSVIDPILVTRTVDEWVDIMVKAGVPCVPVNTVGKALCNPQVVHRNMVISIDDGEGGQIKLAGNPIKMSGTKKETYRYPPALGQDTEETLSLLAGYSREKIAELRAGKVI